MHDTIKSLLIIVVTFVIGACVAIGWIASKLDDHGLVNFVVSRNLVQYDINQLLDGK
jgi:hypothetical protein